MKRTICCVFLLGVTIAALGEARFCAPGDTRPGCQPCPTDRHWSLCKADPCVMEPECPLHKYDNPVCISNYCGGCHAEWFLPSGKQVWCWA